MRRRFVNIAKFMIFGEPYITNLFTRENLNAGFSQHAYS
jgi:hypothetical protein